MQNKDDELIRYLTGKENVEISKPKSKTKPKLKTIVKKIVQEKHKRAERIERRKQQRPIKIKDEAVIHRLTKSPEKLRSPWPISIDPGQMPPCPNRLEMAAGGVGANCSNHSRRARENISPQEIQP